MVGSLGTLFFSATHFLSVDRTLRLFANQFSHKLGTLRLFADRVVEQHVDLRPLTGLFKFLTEVVRPGTGKCWEYKVKCDRTHTTQYAQRLGCSRTHTTVYSQEVSWAWSHILSNLKKRTAACRTPRGAPDKFIAGGRIPRGFPDKLIAAGRKVRPDSPGQPQSPWSAMPRCCV